MFHSCHTSLELQKCSLVRIYGTELRNTPKTQQNVEYRTIVTNKEILGGSPVDIKQLINKQLIIKAADQHFTVTKRRLRTKQV